MNAVKIVGIVMLGMVVTFNNPAKTPVFILTSKSNSKHIQRAMELGVATYIAKPFSRENLIEEIQMVVPLELI